MERVDRYSPMWWYHAPGSGLFLRLDNAYTVHEGLVGKYNSLMLHKTLVQGFGVGTAPGTHTFQVRFALKMQELRLLNYSEAMRIDSVVFPLRSPFAATCFSLALDGIGRDPATGEPAGRE